MRGWDAAKGSKCMRIVTLEILFSVIAVCKVSISVFIITVFPLLNFSYLSPDKKRGDYLLTHIHFFNSYQSPLGDKFVVLLMPVCCLESEGYINLFYYFSQSSTESRSVYIRESLKMTSAKVSAAQLSATTGFVFEEPCNQNKMSCHQHTIY